MFDKKRLMIASAIVTEPRVLLLDEPASGLTKPEIDETIDLIRRLNERGVTLLVIEHVLPLLLTVSARLLVLNHGSELVTGGNGGAKLVHGSGGIVSLRAEQNSAT